MNVFIAVFSTCMKRMRAMGFQFAVFLVMLVAIIELAVFVGMPTQNSLSVAVVGRGLSPVSGSSLAVTELDRDPGAAAVALGRYDLVVTAGPGGAPLVLHARNGKVAGVLLAACGKRAAAGVPGSAGAFSSGLSDRHPMGIRPAARATARGLPSLIMGWLVINILFLGIISVLLLMQDREWKLTARVAAVVPGLEKYLASYGVYVFAVCFLPAFVLIVGQGVVMGTGLGLAVGQWALLLGVTALLATSFAVLMAVLSTDEDQGATMAQMIVIFSSLLSGSFIATADQGPVLRFCAAAMPQKLVMDLCAALGGSGSIIRPLAIVGLYIAVMIAGAILVMRGRLQRGSC